MPLRRIFTAAVLIIGIAVLYSCSSNIKYPKYSGKQPPGRQIYSKPKPILYNAKTSKGIYYLKLHKCRKAVNYFSSLGSSLLPEYCLFVSYGYCSQFKKAKAIFGQLESRNINNRWQARIYSSFGFLSMLYNQKIFRDYLTVAYAYDSDNKLAKELLLRKKITKNDKKRYFNELFMWCENR